MNRFGFPAMLLALTIAGAVNAEEEDITLQQERDQIGAEMEQNRQQIGRDINAIREPDITSGAAAEPGAAGSPAPNHSIGTRATQPGEAPSGSEPNSGVAQPGSTDSPITTTGPGSSTVEPGRSTTTGTPVEPIRNRDANGNASPANGAGAGGIGTSGGNGASGAGGGPAGSAAGGAVGR